MKKLIINIKNILSMPSRLSALEAENREMRIELTAFKALTASHVEHLTSRLNDEIPDMDEYDARLTDLECKLDDYPDYEDIVQTSDYDFDAFVTNDDLPDFDEIDSRITELEAFTECLEGGNNAEKAEIAALDSARLTIVEERVDAIEKLANSVKEVFAK